MFAVPDHRASSVGPQGIGAEGVIRRFGFWGGGLRFRLRSSSYGGQVANPLTALLREESRNCHCYRNPPGHAKPLPRVEVSKRVRALRRACQQENHEPPSLVCH